MLTAKWLLLERWKCLFEPVHSQKIGVYIIDLIFFENILIAKLLTEIIMAYCAIRGRWKICVVSKRWNNATQL